MKLCYAVLILALIVAVAPLAAAQSTETVPKYDVATEGSFKGTIVEISERNCPVSGGLGFHFMLKLQDGKTIEVHVTTTKFMKTYDLLLNKGDQVEVVGSKVKFAGVDTIFAREIIRGEETLVFRDKTGKPVW